MNSKNRTKNLVLSAMFIALAQVLPLVTGQIPEIGRMLLPMHYPVFLCAFVCGAPYGALVGVISPLLRSILFGMPAIYPTALSMACELCAYGFFTGLVYKLLKKHDLKHVYLALIAGMLIGRVVWGLAMTALLSSNGSTFTFQAFLAGGFINALPGIVVQLILIPMLVRALSKANLIK